MGESSCDLAKDMGYSQTIENDKESRSLVIIPLAPLKRVPEISDHHTHEIPNVTPTNSPSL